MSKTDLAGRNPNATIISAAPLTEWQRVANAFTAPSKTFQDIQRGNRSWWLPFIILSLVSYLLFAVIMNRVGMGQVVDNQIRMSPSAADRISALTSEQQAMGRKISIGITEGVFAASPLLTLGGLALLSLGLVGTLNFGFGGRASFGSIYAVWFYAWLPSIVKPVLGMIVVFAGMPPEAFNIKNFAPTNVGAFLDPLETNHALYALASSVDIVTIWCMVLLAMGATTVAGVKRSHGYMAVFGWWTIFVVVRVIWAAAVGQ